MDRRSDLVQKKVFKKKDVKNTTFHGSSLNYILKSQRDNDSELNLGNWQTDIDKIKPL